MTHKEIYTGLMFGSFNPVHHGHLMIASYMKQFTELEEVWLVLSPHNPHKNKVDLLDDSLRLKMLEMAIDGIAGVKICDIELQLEQPSYTAITLAHLEERYLNRRFSLIMGSDNLATLSTWYKAEEIIKRYPLFVYPRPGTENSQPPQGAKIVQTHAPMIEISSSFIRDGIKEGKEMGCFLPEKVYQYILSEELYK